MLHIRRAGPSDGLDLLAWRNDPVTRSHARETEVIDEASHLAWFARTLADSRRLLFIGEEEGGKVGMVRFDQKADGGWEISINVAPAMRGRGIGSRLLAAALEGFAGEFGAQPLEAYVRSNNPASLAVFRRNGFSEGATAEGWVRFDLQR
jgi:RimJ/RimL family protein N-acetyltransferase